MPEIAEEAKRISPGRVVWINFDAMQIAGTVSFCFFMAALLWMDITIMGKRTFNEIEKAENIEACYPATKNLIFPRSRN